MQDTAIKELEVNKRFIKESFEKNRVLKDKLIAFHYNCEHLNFTFITQFIS